VRGFELELRKPLKFLPGVLEDFSFGANYTHIDATVKVPEDQRGGLALFGLDQEERAMEGQPEFLFNLNLTYDNTSSGTSMGLFYNLIGDVLKSGAALGDDPAGSKGTPNIFSLSRPTVDLTFAQKIGKTFKLTVAAKNLMDPDFEEVYRTPDGDELTKRIYQEGVKYSISLGADW
jgi:outer membrane receptor protein involved in Fe transport